MSKATTDRSNGGQPSVPRTLASSANPIRKPHPINTPRTSTTVTTTSKQLLFNGVGGNSTSRNTRTPMTNERATEEEDAANMRIARGALQDFGVNIGELYKGKVVTDH